MATSLIGYTDTLLFLALLRGIENATDSIEVMSFLIKTSYVGETRARLIVNALKAAAARGVVVLVILNYSRFETGVAAENWKTGQELKEAGCHVRMGRRNQTIHTKLIIIDQNQVFVGSHNITRGALSFNKEVTIFSRSRALVCAMMEYFNFTWDGCTRIEDTEPPAADYTPVKLRIQNVATVGNEVVLTFSANHNEGVDAFAAVADEDVDLAGANMGDTVAPTERVARITPLVEPGQTLHVAVRAYYEGTVEAESNIVTMVYQPTEETGGEGGDDGGGGEPPPPEPLTAPTVTTVTQASPTTVTVDWTSVGAADFARFVIQQRDLELEWHEIGIVLDGSAREWTGAPNSMDTINPFHVVVYNTTGQSATSNEVTLTQPALTAPVLESVVAGLNGTEITAMWTFAGCADFHRFEIQKLVGTDWSVVGSTLDPAVRQWVGPGPGAGFTEATYRVVVFNMAEESAASNEITITGEPPVPLTPPVLVSVTQIGPMGINVEYSHVTPTEFTRYEVQQRTNGSWNTLATITTPETRSWSGGPVPYMDADHPVRVVVFVQSGDSAGSNEMVITPM